MEIIPFYSHKKNVANLHIKGLSNDTETDIKRIDKEKAMKYGEMEYQLSESTRYEFKLEILTNELQIGGITSEYDDVIIDQMDEFEDADNIIRGIIRTGNYIGVIPIILKSKKNKKLQSRINIEIISTKLDYRSEYREMLEDIFKYAIDLIYSLPSNISQRVVPDPLKFSKTNIHQYYYLKELLRSSKFEDAIQRILHYPYLNWKSESEEISSNKKFRIGKSVIVQIAKNRPRSKLPEDHYLKRNFGFHSIPKYFHSLKHFENIDNNENQFVKYVLKRFHDFLVRLREISRTDNIKNLRFEEEIEYLISILQNLFENNFFKEISELRNLNFESQVLQKKSGYRFILKSWLEFNISSLLDWSGGDDIFQIGKRNVATLYEYWVFFKLHNILDTIFNFRTSWNELFKVQKDKFQLNLLSGKNLKINRNMFYNGKRVNIIFYYNKTFSHGDPEQESSWSVEMRPDYTTCLWIGDAHFEEAKNIRYIHFDAKYKIKEFEEIKNGEKTITRKTEKREDILRMHAYHDAIRRSYGSYVIYPGESNVMYNEYEEIVPGIGAFHLRPGKDENLQCIKNFIYEVIKFMTEND